MEGFRGYERPGGTVGIRNHVAVISSVTCANGVVDRICSEVPETIKIIHANGCGRGGSDLILHTRTLQNLCKNPNYAAILIVGLGCELIPADSIHLAAAFAKKPSEKIVIQNEGGSGKTIEKGIEIAKRLVKQAKEIKPEMFSFDRLNIGLKCGGSDAFSGLSANPAIGVASDWIVEQGGNSVLTELEELNGTNHILMKRAATENLAKRIDEVINQTNSEAVELLGDFAKLMISAGNIEGGMTTIVEKSLGSAIKGGTSRINEVFEYAEIPTQKGLMIMNGPGYDPEAMTGLAASGCQLILFSTGRGTPLGFPGVPVIKISSNSRLYKNFELDIDINAGEILEGIKSINDVGAEIVDLIKRVASGEKTRAEINKQEGLLCMYTRHRSL